MIATTLPTITFDILSLSDADEQVESASFNWKPSLHT